MRAAIVREYRGVPAVESFPDPTAEAPNTIGKVIAAGLNPLDLIVAAGRFPFRHPDPPFVVGFEGIAQLPDGQLVYFDDAILPYGSAAELTPIDASRVIPLPTGFDPAQAVGLGLSGLAAWLALESRAKLAKGETVLVLGASGPAGQIAVQAARILGAGRVVAAARSEEGLASARAGGANATVQLGAGPDLDKQFKDAAAAGYDVVVDFLWGPPMQSALTVLNMGARVVQVGNTANATAEISAPALRNKSVVMIGYSGAIVAMDEKRSAFDRLARHAMAGELTVELEEVPLDRITDAWLRLQRGARRKLVVIP